MEGGALGFSVPKLQNPLTKVGNPLTASPLSSAKALTDAAKGGLTGAAGAAAAGLKDKAAATAQAKLGEAAGAAQTKLGSAAADLKAKAELEAGKAALRQAGLTDAQIAMAEKGTSFMGGVSKTKEALTSFAGKASLFFGALWAGIKANWFMILIVVACIVALIIIIVQWRKAASAPPPADKTASALAATGKKEGFQDGAAAQAGSEITGPTTGGGSLGETETTARIPPEEELTFVNAQMKTIKQAGYAGPPTGGKFDPEELTAQALKAGFRAFVLQIDSVQTGMDPTAFPEAGVPTLLYRGDDGTLLSANAGSIEAVAKMIASLAFRPEVPDYTLPVILYLHILAAPSPVRRQEEYIRFLSRVARALNPLAPFHLGSTPMGVFHRQKRERDLLHAPIKSLEGQVIILSNADTTLFRAPLPGGKRYDPADDLDYWVNMRVNLDNEDEVHGIAKAAEDTASGGLGPAAVIVSLGSIIRLGAAKRDAFATRGKSRFVIAMPGAMANPSPAELDRALKDLGVNLVPLDIFSVPLEESKKLVELYEGKAYLSKPAALRVHG